MKKLLLICSTLILISQFTNAQITFRGCTSNGLGAQDYTLTATGTTNDGGTIRNTYESSPADFAQSCPAGVCEIRIIWNSGASAWQIQLDNDGPIGTPDYTTACLYSNSTASYPNPPDLTLGTWNDCSGGACPSGEFVTMSGDVQSSISACTEPTIPTITSAPGTICDGNSALLTISGTKNDATAWHVYSGSCGGTSVGTTTGSTVIVTPTPPGTTYYVRGEGGCVSPGSCGSILVSTTARENATFNYSTSAYCVDDSDPTPTITGVGGGSFTSSPGGLSINSSTGAIDVSVSTPNTYTVTYTTSGLCAGDEDVSVTINALDDASFSYSAAAYCADDSDPTPTVTGLGGGTFSAGAGLSINASTGAVDVSVSTPGTYTVTYTTTGACPNSSSVTVTINALDDASFSYSAAAYCADDLDPTPTITGLGGGTFSAGAGLSINASTGAVDVSISTPGTYTVTYTTTGACPNSSSVTVTINALDDASFSYSAAAYCADDLDPTPTITGLGGGTFSAGAGLSINASTGAVDVSVSTPGTYTVTYTTTGACPNSSSVTVTINALDDASFSYSAAAYCADDLDPTPTITGLGGGTFSAGAGLSINASTGAVDVSISTPGTYTVTYTTTGACPNSSSVTVTINALDDASFSYSAAAYCADDLDPTPTITGLGGGTFSAGAGLSINASTGAVDVSISTPGTYIVTYTTTGTCPNSSSVAVTINALDDASFNYSAAAYCASGVDPTPTITGLGGGTFSAGAGLSINASTGAVDVSISTPGTYTVTYTTSGSCPNSSSVSVTINALDDASFSYSAAAYCADDSDPTPTITGLGGGTFSSTAGISLNTSTGVVDLSSTTSGTYTITYTTAGSCSSSSNVNVTITSIANQTVAAASSPICSGTSTTINVGSSELGINYFLRNDAGDVIIDGPIAGTGSGISLNTGNITASTTYNVLAGKQEPTTALNFGGNGSGDYVDMGTGMNSVFSGTNKITVEAWVKRTSSGTLQTIASNYSSHMQFLLRIDSDRAVFWVSNGSFGNAQGATTLPVNTWMHISGTWDGSEIKVYLNGALDGSTPYTGNMPSVGNTFRIGGGFGSEYFPGSIADVSIWNIAKTESQINADQTACLTGGETGIVALYKMGDGSGSMALTDVTGNGYNGNLINMDQNTVWNNSFTSPCVTCDLEMSTLATVNVTPLDDASFSYSASAYCADDIDPTPTITGLAGGTFSSTVGISLNASTGVVDVSTTTPGTYTVTYTTAGSCPNTSSVSVTVNALDDASFNYSASAYCAGDVDPTPTITGLAGGSFSSTAGLSLNASTGVVDVSASTPGTYTVTYTTAGSCSNTSSVSVTVNALDDASFNYSASAYCAGDVDPTPTITGLAGGSFSSTAGLSLNASTGVVDVSATTPGTYSVTYTSTGACPNTSSVSVTINPLDDASFNYSASAYCAGDVDPTPTITGLAGGSFSSTAGLSLNASTGVVDVSATTPGTYSVTYTSAGACPNTSSVSVTINSLDDASFSYSAGSYCADDMDPTPSITGLAGGAFSSTVGLSLNASTGVVDVSASTQGVYTVTYTTIGSCPNTSNVSVTITACSGSECSNAIVIAPLDPCGDSHTETGSTLGGTPSTEGFCGTSLGTGGANWYTFTGDGGNWTASLVSGVTDYDSKIWIYDGTCGALNCVAGNDDFTGVQSQITFATTIGTEYYVVVGGFNTNEGNYELTLSNVETVAPVADLLTLADVNGLCEITSLTDPTATDNCSAVTVTHNATLPITTTSTITWTYTDVAGNSSTQTQEAIVTGAANTGADIQIACGADFTWIDGNVYTTNESAATFTLTNASGCDSVVTLNLTFGTPNTGTDVIVACGADYTWIDGNVYTTDESSATHALTNASGCDSVVTLNLTFGTPNTGTDVIVACGADYTWIDGNVYTTDESAATYTLTNMSGCDSVVTLNLTFGTPNTGTDVVTTCATDYTWIDGNVYTTDESAATFTLTNASGCDSVVTLNLTFITGVPTTGTDTQIACDSYEWIDGVTYTASNTTATHTLTNAAGCDSVVTLDLTINTLDLNVTTAGDGSLMADQAGATYQWITCVDSTAVAGATDQTFAPSTDGDYAVIVTMNNCSDTSACNATTDLVENESVVFSIYPNPNNGIFNIQSEAIGGIVSVISIDGKMVRSNMKINASLTEMNLTDLEMGTYFVKVQFNGNESVERVVIR